MSQGKPEESTPRRARVRISGRVQGVAFRWSTCDEARSRGIEGWVRNLPGGDVEAVFQGPPREVSAMIDWCQKGPPMARVRAVDTSEEEPRAGEFSGFEIRH